MRLSAKLNKTFPRLPLMVLLDGLYPKEPIFSICKKNRWRCVITLKDKSLISVQEQISDKLLFKEYGQESRLEANSIYRLKNYYQLLQIADIINQLTYKSVRLVDFMKTTGLTVKALIIEILSYLKGWQFDDYGLIENIFAKNEQ